MDDNKESKITLDDFDNATDIPFSTTVQTHKVSDFFAVLTPRRYQLLRLCKTGKRSIAELAVAAKRDPAAIAKDIAKLAELGLVSLVVETHHRRNPKTVVRQTEANIEIDGAAL